jgi:NitT/TauT family transport system substrate-binding protein
MSRRFAAAFVLTALVAAAAACGTTGGNTPAPAPGQPDKVVVGVIPIVDVAPIYLGKQMGFFSKRNIELDLQLAQGGAAIVPAVVSGQYQFGFSNVVSLLLAQSRNVPVKVVASGNTSTGDKNKDFGGIVVKKDSTIQGPADLVGKKVSANTLSNIVDTSVREIVRKAGADATKVTFVEMPFPEMPAALQQGRVDAIFVVEPFLSAAVGQGGRIIGTYADVDPNLVVALYFTSNDLSQKNPDLVRRFTEAIKESLAYAATHDKEARDILATYTQLTPEARAALTLPKWPADINRAGVEKLATLVVTDGLLKSPPDLNALLPSS